MLEVIGLTPDDARAASDGGADRLELVGTMAEGGLSPTPGLVERVVAASAVPVRVMLRVRGGFAAGPDEVPELVSLAAAFADAGASGLVFGFLDEAGRPDRPVLDALVAATELPWTFHRALDRAADPDAALAEVVTLPRLDQVLTAGSDAGVPDGLPRLLGWAGRGVVMAGGGLAPEHVPALAAAGIDAFHIGGAARPERSFSSTIEPELVAAWRTLLDEVLPGH